MKSSLCLLFLSPLLVVWALELTEINAKALGYESAEQAHTLDCVRDIGVKPLDSLRSVKPHYQIFVFDLTAPKETLDRIRLLFVQAACLYAAASNHIRIGYIALVNKHRVRSEPSFPDVREFIGMWTEPHEKLLNGLAKARQDTPLTHCEKADLLGHIINRFRKMTKKPFRFLIIDDQKSDDHTNINCDMAYEFGKALYRRNISLDDFVLDEVISRDQDHSSGRRMTKQPIFTMGSLDDTTAFMKGMKTYVDSLQTPEAWNSGWLKSLILDNEHPDEADYVEPILVEPGKIDDVVIEFDNRTLIAALNTTSNSTAGEEIKKSRACECSLNLPIVIGALLIAVLLFLVICCVWEKQQLKNKGVSNTSAATKSDLTTGVV